MKASLMRGIWRPDAGRRTIHLAARALARQGLTRRLSAPGGPRHSRLRVSWCGEGFFEVLFYRGRIGPGTFHFDLPLLYSYIHARTSPRCSYYVLLYSCTYGYCTAVAGSYIMPLCMYRGIKHHSTLAHGIWVAWPP